MELFLCRAIRCRRLLPGRAAAVSADRVHRGAKTALAWPALCAGRKEPRLGSSKRPIFSGIPRGIHNTRSQVADVEILFRGIDFSAKTEFESANSNRDVTAARRALGSRGP